MEVAITVATKAEIQTRTEAITKLREIVNPGDTMHTILRHCSRSGMMRHISVLHDTDDITYLVARALGDKRAENGGIKCSGAGMDMGFDLVYRLGYALHPSGFTCAGSYCHSNDHSNGDRDYTPHHHADGGYALQQRWL